METAKHDKYLNNSEENESKDNFKYIRPNLIKLFSHLILLYLSVNGYNSFLSTQDTYSDFLDNLDDPVIVDVKMISSSSSCPLNYTDIEPTFFPDIRSGCRCDNSYFLDEMCPNIEATARMAGNENSWKNSCTKLNYEESLGRLLKSSNNSFNHLQNLPTRCECYEKITGMPGKKIDTWFKDKKFCILKDNNLTTISYLSSALYENDCPKENLCQTYFCKDKFTNDVSKPCPVVDIYFDHYFYKSEGNKTIRYYNKSDWNMHADSYYSQMFTTNETFENTVIPPMISISISRSGKCASGDNSHYSDHPLLPKVECPIDQKYYSLSKLSLQDVLYNNNYLKEVMKIPGMNKTLNSENRWSLDAQYGFHKFTLYCLMNNYDKVNSKKIQALNNTSISDFTYKQKKIGYILEGFVQFSTEFQFQEHLQTTILAVNLTLVAGTVITVVYKILSICFNCKFCHQLFSLEAYFTFSIEFILGALGGATYFLLGDYIDFLDSLVNSSCVDNYVQYKFGIFLSNLEDTSDRNLEVFLIVVLKILLIIFSMIYYSCSRKKMTCGKVWEIIKESINEGEGEDEEEKVDENEENIKLKKIDGENKLPTPMEKKSYNENDDIQSHNNLKMASSDHKLLSNKIENKDEINDYVLPVEENIPSSMLPDKNNYETVYASDK